MAYMFPWGGSCRVLSFPHWNSKSDRFISVKQLIAECTWPLTLILQQMLSQPFPPSLLLLEEYTSSLHCCFSPSEGNGAASVWEGGGKLLSTWGVGGSVSRCLRRKHLRSLDIALVQMVRCLLNFVPIPKGRKFDLNIFAMAIYFTMSQEFIRKTKRIMGISLDWHFPVFLLVEQIWCMF